MLVTFITLGIVLCSWVFIVMIRHENFKKRNNITKYKRQF